MYLLRQSRLTSNEVNEGVSKTKKRPQYKSKLATLVKYT